MENNIEKLDEKVKEVKEIFDSMNDESREEIIKIYESVKLPSLVSLLVKKGILTELEYNQQVIRDMEIVKELKKKWDNEGKGINEHIV